MSRLRQMIKWFLESVGDELMYDPPENGDRSIYLKSRPQSLKPGQVWWARPVTERTLENPWIPCVFVLTYVSEQQDHCRGFLLIDGPSGVLDLADAGDVKLPFDESPIDDAVVCVWRGEINLAPQQLRSYYGNISEAKLREIMGKYVPVMTRQQAAPPQRRVSKPVRDMFWKLTAFYDTEAIELTLQD